MLLNRTLVIAFDSNKVEIIERKDIRTKEEQRCIEPFQRLGLYHPDACDYLSLFQNHANPNQYSE